MAQARMFIYEFLEEMPEIRAHCHRISAQFEAAAHIRENIQPCLEVVCQMDYSENWVSKFFKEISAVYFDNAQFTLHTMVITFKTKEGELRTKTYVGVTRETSHSAATTFSFIKKLVTVLFDFLPALSVMHFVSDGPSNQYRNRTIVQLVRRFPQLFAGVRASWCWLESGHGKGPCDGVGGGIKKKADNLIKGGKIIRTIHEMAKCLEEAGSTSVMLKVTKAEIQETRDEMKEWQIPAVKGLMTTHMLAPKGDSMFIRTVACYKECCNAETNFMLACDGWANVEQKKKTKRKAQKAPKTEKAKKAKKTQKDDEDDDEDEEEYEVVVPKKAKKVKQPKKTKKEKGSDDEDDEDYQVPLLKVHTVGEKHATRQSARAAKPAVAMEEDLETDTHIAEVHQALETDTTPPKPAVAVDEEEDDVPLALLALETDTTPPKPAVAVEEDLETDTHIAEVHQALETDTTPPKPAVAVDKEDDDVPLALLALETDTTPAKPAVVVEVDLETDTDTTPAKLVHRALETDTTPTKPAVAVEEDLETDTHIAEVHHALETDTTPAKPAVAVEEDLETDTHIAEVHHALETDTVPAKPAVAVEEDMETDTHIAEVHQALETDTTPPKPAVAVEEDMETDTHIAEVHQALETDTTPPKPAVAVEEDLEKDTTEDTPDVIIVDEEDDDVPLALLSLLNKWRTHSEDIEEGDYVTVVYGKRWYPVVVTGVKGNEFNIMYMKPCRGHWKWGPPDYGTVQREGILLKISQPQQHGKLWKLSDQRDVQRVYQYSKVNEKTVYFKN